MSRTLRITRIHRNNRATSPVISSLILVSAVLVAGFVLLSWAQSQSANYKSDYTRTVNADIDTLSEYLSYEYIFYNSTNHALVAYLLNSGQIFNVNLASVYMSNSSGWNQTFNVAQFQLKFLDGSNSTALDPGQEGYFEIASITLQPNTTYSVKIVTSRGSSFANSFVA